jgi:hypothetical protein
MILIREKLTLLYRINETYLLYWISKINDQSMKRSPDKSRDQLIICEILIFTILALDNSSALNRY